MRHLSQQDRILMLANAVYLSWKAGVSLTNYFDWLRHIGVSDMDIISIMDIIADYILEKKEVRYGI